MSHVYICWNAGVTLDDCCENWKILLFLQLCSKIMRSDNTKRSHELLISHHKNVSNQKVSHLLAAWWTEAHFHPLTETQRKRKGSPRDRWWSRPAPWFKSGTKKKKEWVTDHIKINNENIILYIKNLRWFYLREWVILLCKVLEGHVMVHHHQHWWKTNQEKICREI